jgi:FkbM family methyltransferase
MNITELCNKFLRRTRNQLVPYPDPESRIEINIAANKGLSSSIADMLPNHIENAPEAQYVSKEKVPIRKLDSIFDQFLQPGDNVFLKIDTQGYEINVLDGAEKSLPKIKGIQVEMSLVPLYSGEMLFPDMLRHLTGKGYTMFDLGPVFTSPTTGQLLQVDGMFFSS